MSCFGICFGKKIKKEENSCPNTIVIKKPTEARRLSNANTTFYRGNTTFSITEKENVLKNSLVQTQVASILNNNFVAEKPLKKLLSCATPSKFYKPNDSYASEEVHSSPSLKKKTKTHWNPKDTLHCYFCGGEKCKHENWKNHHNPAIQGLHSDFVNEVIIASQRPSTILINQYNLIKKFKALSIALIVNVQREGEHPYCGPNKGLEEASGFAYDPHVFISEDIRVRQTGWKDMSVPDSMSFMLEIVKDMAVTIKENGNKVLVHCHAGYGRTGVVIACYLIYMTNKSVHDIIEYIRDRRPGCIQKSSQYKYCKKFKNYIDRCRPIFGEKNAIEFYLKNQADLLYGDNLKRYEFIPRLLSIVLEKIEDLLHSGQITKESIYLSMFYPEDWSDENESQLVYLKTQINLGHWQSLNDKIEIKVLSQLLYDWLEDSVVHVISSEKIYLVFQEKGLSKLIESHISNTKEFSSANRKKLSEDIKQSLRTIESETLCCVANFLNKIKPDIRDTNLFDSYTQVAKRLCAALLGFDTKETTNNKDIIEKMIDYAHRLFNLISFFGIVLEKDIEDEIVITKKTCFSPYVNRRKIQEGIKPRQMSDIELDPTVGVTNENPKNNMTININNSYNNINDYAMYEVYKVLDGYFANNKDRVEQLKTQQSSCIQTSYGSNNSVADLLKTVLAAGRTNTETIGYSDVPGHLARRTRREITFGTIKANLIKGTNKVTSQEPLFKLNMMMDDRPSRTIFKRSDTNVTSKSATVKKVIRTDESNTPSNKSINLKSILKRADTCVGNSKKITNSDILTIKMVTLKPSKDTLYLLRNLDSDNTLKKTIVSKHSIDISEEGSNSMISSSQSSMS
jgi:hypothetical protein